MAQVGLPGGARGATACAFPFGGARRGWNRVHAGTRSAGAPVRLGLAILLDGEGGVAHERGLGGRGAHVVQHHPLAAVGEVALDAVLQRGRRVAVDQRQHIHACGAQAALCDAR